MSYDPFDPTIPADPYPVYAALRNDAPLHHSATTDTYVLSRFDDVAWALGETDLLSSDAIRGVLLGQPTGIGEERLPRSAAMGVLVSVDAPGHTELRRIVNRGFTPHRITGWNERISEFVAGLLAERNDAEPFDVIGGLAAPLPVRVIAELLGADAAQADQFKIWAGSLTRSMNGSQRDVAGFDEEAMQAAMGLAMHLGAQIEDRKINPRDDLLSAIVRAHGDDALEQQEAIGFAGLLLFAGTETTTNLIGNACWSLFGNPAELRALLDDPSRLHAVLEETLRWESPVQYVFRRATRSFERHGVTVPQDATVTLLLGAANRDPRRWGDDADRFIVGRDAGGHVGFGFGPHFCLGAALARAEAALSLEQLLPSLDGAAIVAGGDDYIDSLQFRGRRRLLLSNKGEA